MLIAMLASVAALLGFGKKTPLISVDAMSAVSGMAIRSLAVMKTSTQYCWSSMGTSAGGGKMAWHWRKPARLRRTNHRRRQLTSARVTALFFGNSQKGGVDLVWRAVRRRGLSSAI